MSKKYTTNFLEDTNGSTGSANQVLVSTPAGIDWVDGSGSGIIGGPYLPLAGGTMSGNTNHSDNVKDRYGTGNDFQIWHDGSNTFLSNEGEGHLNIINTGDDRDIVFKTDDGSGATTSYMVVDGSAEQTRFYKDTRHTDNVVANFGNSDDLKIYHDGTNSRIYNDTGDLYIRNNSDNKNIYLQSDNGSGGISSYLTLDGSTTHAYFSNPGNVGIGTTSPSHKLDISGGKIQINDGGAAWFGSDSTGAFIRTFNGNTVRFLSSANAETMRINNATGNVGIGTTSPVEKLSVSGGNIAVNNGNQIMVGGATGDTKIGKLYNVSGVLSLDGEGNRSIRLGSATNGEVVRIDNTNERVGIGTTNPLAKTHIKASNSGGDSAASGTLIVEQGSSPSIQLLSANSQTQTIKFADPQSSQIGRISYSHPSDAMFFVTNGGERMRIAAAGNVGIGTTSPVSPLTVKSNSVSSGNSGIVIQANGSTDSIIKLGEKSTNGARLEMLDAGVTKIALFTDGTDNYIAAGNVGIGTTSPGTKLHVGAGSGATVDTGYQAVIDSAGIAGLQILSATTQSGRIVFGDSDDNDIGMIKYDHTDNSMGFRTNGSANERMRITNAGNVGIGATSFTSKLHVEATGTSNIRTLQLNGVGAGTTGIRVASGSAFLDIANNLNHTQIVAFDTANKALVYQQRGSGGGGNAFPAHQFTGDANTSGAYPAILGAKGGAAGAALFIGQQADNTTVFTVEYDGKVGIGTDNPSERLHVNGGLRLDGSVYNSNLNYLEFTPNGSDSFISQKGGGNSLILRGNNGVKLQKNSGTNVTVVLGEDAQKIVASGTSDSISLFTSSTEKLRIDSSGKVGIGTTIPSAKLEVSSTSGWGLFTERGIKDGSTSTYSHNYNAGNAHVLGRSTIFESSVTFSTSTASSTTKAYRFNNQSDKLVLVSVVAGVATDNNILVISGTNIGIGTTTPDRTLDVEGSGRFVNNNTTVDINNSNYVPLKIDHTNGYAHARINGFEVGGETTAYNEGYIKTADNSRVLKLNTDGWLFKVTSAEKMRLTPSGNLGIGTTNPGSTLPTDSETASKVLQLTGVSGNTGDTAVLLRSSDNSSGLDLWHNASTGDSYIDNRFNAAQGDTIFRVKTAGTPLEALRIAGDGNVGIGTSSPAEKLHIFGTTAAVKIEGNGVTSANLKFKTNETDRWNVNVPSGSTDLRFTTGSSDTLTLKSNGNVGIGTTSPSEKLDIEGNVRVGQNNGFYINNQNVGIKRDSNDLVLGGFGNVIIKSSSTTVVNQAERMRITSAGNVGIGTTSPDYKLDVEGDISLVGGGENYAVMSPISQGMQIAVGDPADIAVPLVTFDGENQRVGIGTTNPAAKLDIESTTSGVLLPRMTTAQVNAISSPSNGLTVYNTTLNTLCFYNGSSWQKVNHANM